jgi:hypothetical protein
MCNIIKFLDVKKIIKIIAILIINLLLFTGVSAYDLTSKDEIIVEKLENKIFKIIDS